MSFTNTVASSTYSISPTGTVAYVPAAGKADVGGEINPARVLNSTLTSAGLITGNLNSLSIGGGLVAPLPMRQPGVFTAGTPVEGSASNPNNYSIS